MVLDIKYVIPSINLSLVLLILLYGFYCIHYETCGIYCHGINSESIVVSK